MQKRGRGESMWLKWEAKMYGKDMSEAVREREAKCDRLVTSCQGKGNVFPFGV